MNDTNFQELSNEDLETAAGGCRPRCGGCWGGGFGTGPVVINTPGAIPGYPGAIPGYPGAIPVGGVPGGGIPGFPGGYGAPAYGGTTVVVGGGRGGGWGRGFGGFRW